jgi:aspartyl-tRNA(Asn)/glutamyl-tRNA(Gln) amidotransferase subunit A
MCRSVEDCGLVLQAMSGGDSKDPGSAGRSFYYTPQYARKLTDLKVGFAPDDMEWAETGARPAFTAAMETIKATGIKLVEVKLPDFPWGAIISTIVSVEGASVFEPLIASGKVNELADPKQIEGLKAGLEIPARDYLKAMRIRTLVKEKFAELFDKVDLLVSPSRFGIAPKITEPLDAGGRPGGRPASAGFAPLIPAGNLAGLPALSLPCGFSEKMPVALQLCGPAFSENTLLALGRDFQTRTDWHKQHPTIG